MPVTVAVGEGGDEAGIAAAQPAGVPSRRRGRRRPARPAGRRAPAAARPGRAGGGSARGRARAAPGGARRDGTRPDDGVDAVQRSSGAARTAASMTTASSAAVASSTASTSSSLLANQYRTVCLRTPTSAAISSSDTASTPRVPNRPAPRRGCGSRVVAGDAQSASRACERAAEPGRATDPGSGVARPCRSTYIELSRSAWGSADVVPDRRGDRRRRTASIRDTAAGAGASLASSTVDRLHHTADAGRRRAMADLGSTRTALGGVAMGQPESACQRGRPRRLHAVDDALLTPGSAVGDADHWDLPQDLEDAGGWAAATRRSPIRDGRRRRSATG